jgi:hypothetical protein
MYPIKMKKVYIICADNQRYNGEINIAGYDRLSEFLNESKDKFYKVLVKERFIAIKESNIIAVSELE